MDDPEAIRRVREALAAAKVDSATVEAAVWSGMRGLAHSVLVILDGGTKMSEHGRVHLQDARGRSLGEGLHELFFVHLQKTRIRKR